jgi:hypothetical protein
MISNANLQEISTQAIAESVGFKMLFPLQNFNKRTGVTPFNLLKDSKKDLIIKSLVSKWDLYSKESVLQIIYKTPTSELDVVVPGFDLRISTLNCY